MHKRFNRWFFVAFYDIAIHIHNDDILGLHMDILSTAGLDGHKVCLAVNDTDIAAAHLHKTAVVEQLADFYNLSAFFFHHHGCILLLASN